MATTTYFGWETPDDTDLVKDGAAAIRTLGSAIDSSMSQLEGGTTGQILSKTSATDMAFTWINNDQGDITGVTAGTGISGGGTSGTVTVTNSMATAITTAGDLIKGTGSGTFDRLGIGSTSQILTVVAGAPAWASPAAGGGMTSIASGSLSGNTLSLTSISGSYKNLQLLLRDVGIDAQSSLIVTFNGLSANYFDSNYGHHTTTTAFNEGNVNRAYGILGGYENQVANTSVSAHVIDFFDYTSNDVKICRKSGYVDGRTSTPYLYNSAFGNYASGARAAITSVTITVQNGGNFNNGTYILYGVS